MSLLNLKYSVTNVRVQIRNIVPITRAPVGFSKQLLLIRFAVSWARNDAPDIYALSLFYTSVNARLLDM